MIQQRSDAQPSSRIHLASLMIAITIMLACTLYPPMMATSEGKADHALAGALFAAMSVAFVRGVGFIPRRWLWRWLFSGWTCTAALVLAGWLMFVR
ncbi:cyd operon YbgE family protein [Pseudomonas sp. 39167]|uniref:cyd operon YbgE family protein n=1 Tax=Pseudomonas sp. 39167 TaxID=2967215 RepID=UPI002363C827|nr:cyd operon YbgE family protein [Pseudomonas sp. 39167]MDD2030512.1 cyd operon YbgE family protein [Pseudomonas sp. 39167]